MAEWTPAAKDFHYDVARGIRSDMQTWNKFGYNRDVDTGAAETIWAAGGTFNIMPTASTVNIVSSSASDQSDTVGATQVQIIGIDENRDIQSEIVNLSGTTNVTTSSQWLGINRVQILNSGTNQANVGQITVTEDNSSTTQAVVPAGEGVTQQAIFHVPQNYTFYTDWLYININKSSGGGSPQVNVRGWVYSAVTNTKYNVFESRFDASIEDIIQLRPTHPFVIDGQGVLYFEASTSANNTDIACRFSGMLIKN